MKFGCYDLRAMDNSSNLITDNLKNKPQFGPDWNFTSRQIYDQRSSHFN